VGSGAQAEAGGWPVRAGPGRTRTFVGWTTFATGYHRLAVRRRGAPPRHVGPAPSRRRAQRSPAGPRGRSQALGSPFERWNYMVSDLKQRIDSLRGYL